MEPDGTDSRFSPLYPIIRNMAHSLTGLDANDGEVKQMVTDNLDSEIDRFLSQTLGKSAATTLSTLMEGYRLSALSEGKSHNTVAIINASVRYLEEFLTGQALSTDVTEIGANGLRQFSVSLRERRRFANHRFTKPQAGQLSGHTINGYMRALQAFWSWLEREEFINENPFAKVKIPKAPKKVIPVFSEEQLRQLFATINISSTTGYRDYTIILTLLDTGIRCSELTGLRLDDVNLENRSLKV